MGKNVQKKKSVSKAKKLIIEVWFDFSTIFIISFVDWVKNLYIAFVQVVFNKAFVQFTFQINYGEGISYMNEFLHYVMLAWCG